MPFPSVKRPKRSNSCKKVQKIFWVCDLFILKDSAFTAVKRDATTVVIQCERGGKAIAFKLTGSVGVTAFALHR